MCSMWGRGAKADREEQKPGERRESEDGVWLVQAWCGASVVRVRRGVQAERFCVCTSLKL